VLPLTSRTYTFALVAPYLPAPANTGGRIRIHRLARGLARFGPVDLYARYWPVEIAPEAGDVASALSLYARRELHDRGRFAGVPGVTSRRAREAAPRALCDALARQHRATPYDAVVACHSYGALAAMGLRGPALVVDEHNIESRYARAVTPDARVEAAKLQRWERAVWRRADLVTAVSDDDAREVGRSRSGATAVVPNGVACAEIEFIAPSRRASREILFVGAMSHPPNVRCAVELAREVLPRVRRTHPDARLILCGRAPVAEVRALASRDVEVTGTVDDVAPWLARAGVYVNLLRAGAGSSLKVPEALAAGVPLVSTRTGVRGFALDDRHLHIAETADDAARAVLEAWRSPAASDARAHAARAVAATLDWDILGERFARLVMGAVDAKRAS
jgi:glycosyltransferase involved in cell wall biosynthesis